VKPWALSALAVATVGCATLAAAQPGAPQAAKRSLQFLSAEDVAPAQILPPPPLDGGDVTRAELAELHAIAKVATGAQWEQAAFDDEHEDGAIFQSAIGPAYDLVALPATAKLLAEVRNEEAVAAGLAKDYFKRTRPWILDGSLKTCSRGDAPQSSYPSGHATMAYAMAGVLARVAPVLAPQVMRRAADYSDERLVCGMHYRSDIVAGQVLGTTVAALMLRDPRVQADVAASRSELEAAHIVAP
jgi:acid phosphatase (class A)